MSFGAPVGLHDNIMLMKKSKWLQLLQKLS